MTTPSLPPHLQRIRELLVPVIMIVTIGLYTYTSAYLSSTALIFPAVLIVAIIITLLWPITAAFVRQQDAEIESSNEEHGPILDIRPWSLIVLPVLLFAVFEQLGALISLVALIYGTQLMLSTKSPLRDLIVAMAAAIPVYIMFKYFLYVRFPLGALGIG